MVPDSSPNAPIAPMSVGNIVSSAIRLYRDRPKVYLGIALKATSWAALPFVTIFPLFAFAAYNQINPFIWIVIVPLGLVAWFYCSAKSLLNTALISRIIFSFLVDRPETTPEAIGALNPKMWRFLWVQFLLQLLLFVVNLGLTIAQNFILLPLELFLGLGDSGLALLFVLLNLVIRLIFFEIYLYIYAYYFIVEVPVAIEPNLIATQALDRSFKLSNGSIFRIQGAFLIATLISSPPYILAAVPFFFIIFNLVQSGFFLPGELATIPSAEIWQSVGLAALMFFLIILVLNVFILPFWQALKSVMYYDLRTRKEGIDLNLSDRAL
ncbi:MAG: hypothetical protein SWY16_24075 [Cyanobacteriota bacterium]|nr:hypothetical protein [Cyanobacteriota bacterium]